MAIFVVPRIIILCSIPAVSSIGSVLKAAVQLVLPLLPVLLHVFCGASNIKFFFLKPSPGLPPPDREFPRAD
jgi:hypothetical protein